MDDDEVVINALFEKHSALSAILNELQMLKSSGKKYNIRVYYDTKAQLKKIEQILKSANEESEEEGEN